MTTSFVRHIEKTGLINTGDCLLIGLSGGPDSVCLLHVLAGLREKWSLTLYAAHLNHNLRGMAANQDASFAMAFSKSLKVHCLVKSVDVESVARDKKLSIEAAGRLCRYRFLEEVAEKTGANKIAVGHHLNDQAETLLLHLLRGSGLTGMAGMSPHRGKVIRPLLQISREEILFYCAQNELQYCIDATNEEAEATRNRIRLELIPFLQGYNPQVVSALGRTAVLLEKDESALDKMAQAALEDTVDPDQEKGYDIEKLQKLSDAVLSRVIRKAWRRMTETTHTLQTVHVTGVLQAVRQPGHEKWFFLPGNIRMQVTGRSLICHPEKVDQPDIPDIPPVVLRHSGLTWLPGGRGVVSCIRRKAEHPLAFSQNPYKQVISADQVTDDLVIRQRSAGDYWQPLGLKGKKSLKKTLMEMKLSRNHRDKCLVMCHRDEIVWVMDGEISEKVRVTRETKEILILEYRRLET